MVKLTHQADNGAKIISSSPRNSMPKSSCVLLPAQAALAPGVVRRQARQLVPACLCTYKVLGCSLDMVKNLQEHATRYGPPAEYSGSIAYVLGLGLSCRLCGRALWLLVGGLSTHFRVVRRRCELQSTATRRFLATNHKKTWQKETGYKERINSWFNFRNQLVLSKDAWIPVHCKPVYIPACRTNQKCCPRASCSRGSVATADGSGHSRASRQT